MNDSSALSDPISAATPVTPTSPLAGSPVSALVDDLCAAAPAAAREAYAQAKEKTVEVGRQVAATVRRHPVESMAVAVGAGLLVWWLLSRNREHV